MIRNFLPVLGVAILGWLGETGHDGGLVKDVWTALKTASPPVAMILFLVWMWERKERQTAQQQCNERTIDFIKSTNAMTTAFDRALSRIAGRRR